MTDQQHDQQQEPNRFERHLMTREEFDAWWASRTDEEKGDTVPQFVEEGYEIFPDGSVIGPAYTQDQSIQFWDKKWEEKWDEAWDWNE
jgi:hypothetical protein